MTAASGRPLRCGAAIGLQEHEVYRALQFDRTGLSTLRDVMFAPGCYLEQHNGEHHALVLELPGPRSGAVWAVWRTGHRPYFLVLPDCPAISADRREDACGGYRGHPGAHAWELYLGRVGVPARGRNLRAAT